MRDIAVRLIALWMLVPGFSARGQDLPPLGDSKVAHAKYDELVGRINSGDLKVDWRELRLDARVGEVAGDYDLQDADKRAKARYDQGDFEGALKISREAEQHSIADGQAHLTAMNSLIVLGRKDEADKEHKILVALLDSITKSGDGKSIKTAWFAVSIPEEFVYLYALQVQYKEQHSVRQDGHYYDAVLVTDKSGKEKTVWFNTDTDISVSGRAATEGHHIY